MFPSCQICQLEVADPRLDLCPTCQKQEDDDRMKLYSHVKGMHFKIDDIQGPTSSRIQARGTLS